MCTHTHTHIHSVSHSKAGVMAQKQHMGESDDICIFNSIQFNLLRKLKQPTENEVVSEGLAALRNHYGSCKVLATALQLPVMISEPPKPPSQLWHTLDVQRCKSI